MATIDYSSTGIVTAPISPTAVGRLIGTYSNDVGTNCISSLVNKWAKFKPQKIAGNTLLTLAQRKADHMGLTPLENTKLKEASYDGSGSYTPDEVRADIDEWEYNQPTLGDAFRLDDFLNSDDVKSNGYNHQAKPSDYNWSDEVFTSSSLSNAASCTVDYADGVFTCQINRRYSKFNADFAGSSGSRIGSADESFLPLSWIVGDTVVSDDWRFGLAVYVPYDATNVECNKWMFCVSDKPLKDISNASDVANALPDLTTNQWLCKCLAFCADSKGITDFDCVPCLIKGFGQETIIRDAVEYSYVNVVSATVYSMPSGTKDLVISVPSSSSMPTLTLNNKEYTAKKQIGNTNWYIFEIPNGAQASTHIGSTTKICQIKAIVILYCTMDTTTGYWQNVSNTAKTFDGQLVYSVFDNITDTSKTQHTVSGLSVAANNTIQLTFADTSTQVDVYGLYAVSSGLDTLLISSTLS